MRVLVLGADGMLGHELTRTLVAAGHLVVATTRRAPDSLTMERLAGAQIFPGVDARMHDTVTSVLAEARPAAVLNCVGIVKQRAEARHAVESIRINSLFPHQLANLCTAAAARLVHMSTDCVFSGRVGNYTEDDIPDPVDLYGRSKLLGEVTAPGCLTLRMSIVGLELTRKGSLVEWFLRQEGRVDGWTKAGYSGLTTMELSRIVVRLLEDWPDVDGLWQISSDRITKYDLLVMLRDALGRKVEIVPDPRVSLDRTLDSRRLRDAVKYEPPSWQSMASELAAAVHRREAGEHV